MPVERKPLFRPDVVRAHLAGFRLPAEVEDCRESLEHWAKLSRVGTGGIRTRGKGTWTWMRSSANCRAVPQWKSITSSPNRWAGLPKKRTFGWPVLSVTIINRTVFPLWIRTPARSCDCSIPAIKYGTSTLAGRKRVTGRLVRARAAALLKARGYDVSDLALPQLPRQVVLTAIGEARTSTPCGWYRKEEPSSCTEKA